MEGKSADRLPIVFLTVTLYARRFARPLRMQTNFSRKPNGETSWRKSANAYGEATGGNVNGKR